MSFSLHWNKATLSIEETAALAPLAEHRSGSPEWCLAITGALKHPATAVRGIALDAYGYFIGPTQRQGAWPEPAADLHHQARACALHELQQPAYNKAPIPNANHASALYALGIGQLAQPEDADLIAHALRTHPRDENILNNGLSAAGQVFLHEGEPCRELINAVEQVATDTDNPPGIRCQAIRERAGSPDAARTPWLESLLDGNNWELRVTALTELLYGDPAKYRQKAQTFLDAWEGERPFLVTELQDLLEETS